MVSIDIFVNCNCVNTRWKWRDLHKEK